MRSSFFGAFPCLFECASSCMTIRDRDFTLRSNRYGRTDQPDGLGEVTRACSHKAEYIEDECK